MPYCPQCRREFMEQVGVCPDCGTGLVDSPAPPEGEGGRGPLVQVAVAPNYVIASLWASVLEEEGIHCLVRGSDLMAAMYMLPMNATHQLYVVESQAEQAKEILDSLTEEGPLTDEPDLPDED
jgi:hypothetical protein